MEPVNLRRSHLLGRLAEDDLRALLASGRARAFAAQQVLFQRGDPGDGLYVIASGEVRIVIESVQGTEVAIAVLGAGDVLGELSLLDGAPRSATAVARAPVEALHISTGHFESWLMERPRAANMMLAELARRLRATDEQMAEIALLNLETRIARRIWQRFVDSSRDARPAAGMTIRLNQGHLAAELGVTRESVNKHLARLKAPGIVVVRGNDVTLLDPAALRAMADLGA